MRLWKEYNKQTYIRNAIAKTFFIVLPATWLFLTARILILKFLDEQNRNSFHTSPTRYKYHGIISTNHVAANNYFNRPLESENFAIIETQTTDNQFEHHAHKLMQIRKSKTDIYRANKYRIMTKNTTLASETPFLIQVMGKQYRQLIKRLWNMNNFNLSASGIEAIIRRNKSSQHTTDGVESILPGENGSALNLDVNALGPKEKNSYINGYKQHNFNEFASQLISVHRSVPDFRPAECLAKNYSKDVNMTSASVIMCFYNEAWSTLLRSVHSVIDRSPPKLFRELILVDDHSDAEHLKDKLDNYMEKIPKVRIIRMEKRMGIVGARMKGINAAMSTILIFLDSHVECGNGWIEPLIHEVVHNPTVSITPVIDIIDRDNMAVDRVAESIGVVDIRHMTFQWSRPTRRIQRKRLSPDLPFMSPTMAGGLFAISKPFFLEIGTWDPGLYLWGGENIELSFKLWMCGGAIWTHPCSHVSHVYRTKSPYMTANLDSVLQSNNARVAEVWLDEYKKFFFRREAFNTNKYGDVSEQKQLRQALSCHSFQWYVDNVYPEIFIDGAGEYMSQLKTSAGLCVHIKEGDSSKVNLDVVCEGAPVWQSSNTQEIRHGQTCLQVQNNEVVAAVCNSLVDVQAFLVKNDKNWKNEQSEENGLITIVHVQTKMCVTSSVLFAKGAYDDMTRSNIGSAIYTAPCLLGEERQLWDFKRNVHMF